MRALKIRSVVASHQKLTITNWEQSSKLILLQLHEKLLKNSMSSILQLFGIWSKLKRWKTLISGWLELTKNKKYRHFKVSSSLILCNSEPFLNQSVTCNEKWILYDTWWWSAQWLDREDAANHFPKPNLHQKIHDYCLVVRCQSDPLQLSQSLQNHCIWEVCYKMHWKLQCLKPKLVNIKGPILLHHNTWPHLAQPILQKLDEFGYEVLPHPPYSSHLSTPNYHFFKHLNNFLQRKHFHNQQEAKHAFQEFLKSQSRFYAKRINKLISCWQKCTDCDGSYFD